MVLSFFWGPARMVMQRNLPMIDNCKPFSFTKNSFRLQEFSFINFRLQNNFRLHFRLRILGFDLDFRLLILDFRLLISYFRLLIFRINFNH